MNNHLVKITAILIIAANLLSCNNTPSDLKEKKDNWNKLFTELDQKSQKNVGHEETNNLIIEFQELRKEAVLIISEFDRRGVKDINKNILNDVDEKIKTLKQSLAKKDK